MMQTNNVRYLYAAVVALLSWWLVQLTEFGTPQGIVVGPHSPDYFSKGYSKWEMDGQGRLKKQLLTDEIIHFSDDGITHLLNPLISFYRDSTPPWVVGSASGVLSADGKELLLNGKVTIDRAAAAQVRALKINTSNLKVLPETSYAETKEQAELISPPNWTTGIGMKLVFIEPIRLQLLDKVKGEYEKK